MPTNVMSNYLTILFKELYFIILIKNIGIPLGRLMGKHYLCTQKISKT